MVLAGQGCPNEGADTRIFGSLVRRLQRSLSWPSLKEPTWLAAKLPYVGIAWPPYIIVQVPQGGRWWMARAGFRYDFNAKMYIFPALAFKHVAQPMKRGY